MSKSGWLATMNKDSPHGCRVIIFFVLLSIHAIFTFLLLDLTSFTCVDLCTTGRLCLDFLWVILLFISKQSDSAQLTHHHHQGMTSVLTLSLSLSLSLSRSIKIIPYRPSFLSLQDGIQGSHKADECGFLLAGHHWYALVLEFIVDCNFVLSSLAVARRILLVLLGWFVGWEVSVRTTFIL